MGTGYKWRRIQLLKTDDALNPHIPETALFSKPQLWTMLRQFENVIVKPSNGQGGYGIVQVSKEGEIYHIHKDSYKRKYLNRDTAYAKIRQLTRGRAYIIQQRIPLAQIAGRPFDVRVMVQRMPGQNWVVTGKLAKVAGPGFIVTNMHRSRGKILSVGTALSRSTVKHIPQKTIEAELDRISLLTAKVLGNRFPAKRVFGIDMGIDLNGKVWIIESNFAPSVSLFRHLQDKSMYHRILRFRKAS
ncbi:YheC/YheD family protein [Ferviditalea candida]|uniref:YheC/YheD family protein n=1 Tax=Ferviditalea candida TaxID=3108399 RepID=A0ABU5ZI30_9BACL|nr:YheC/YheD family protein [Paenibacillaceae bacterium T2]